MSRPYADRPGCNYCNNCGRGCPRADKGSVDVTFIHQALRTGNCTIRTRASVLAIETSDNDRVGAVLYRDVDNNEVRVRARAIVVACGAVETPRLLLNSADRHAQNGLANESGQVGRNFMETIFWRSSALHPEPLGSHRGIPADGICWDYNKPDAIDDVIGGCRFNTSTGEVGLVGPINYARRIVGGWGRQHKQRMREMFGRVIAVGAVGESLPNADSRIDLDPEARDEHGISRARIHSHLDDMALRRLSFMWRQMPGNPRGQWC
ncbi:MAG: GMC family oxidoreductase N-terminal domain-containing protein [Gammaproteobacteria bacterium]|nr:GMC family oxidoreductase N-terminal domain-containing protein [Gammaproteobacteria bacterium]